MAEDNPNENPIAKKNTGGRPAVLDEKKQRQVVALLAHGISRSAAARVVGCATSTIARTAIRDPDFAARLQAAEHKLEIEILQHLEDAAKTSRYWRAGAWLLERRYPRDYARQTPTTLSEEDVANMAMRLAEPEIYNMSNAQFDEYLDRVYDMAPRLLRQQRVGPLPADPSAGTPEICRPPERWPEAQHAPARPPHRRRR